MARPYRVVKGILVLLLLGLAVSALTNYQAFAKSVTDSCKDTYDCAGCSVYPSCVMVVPTGDKQGELLFTIVNGFPRVGECSVTVGIDRGDFSLQKTYELGFIQPKEGLHRKLKVKMPGADTQYTVRPRCKY